MGQKRIQQIEQRIDRIKKALLEIGPMRPGSLTRQYKDPQHQAGAYWQISYTRRMKSRTEYVRRPDFRRGGQSVSRLRRRPATGAAPMLNSSSVRLRRRESVSLGRFQNCNQSGMSDFRRHGVEDELDRD